MIQLALARYGLHIAIAGGLAVTVLAWDRNRIRKAEVRGVEKEQVRVETTGRKINAQAQSAAAAAARKPHDSLRPWYRD